MSQPPKAPGHTTVTFKARAKKRCVRLDEATLIDVLRIAAKPIEKAFEPRAASRVSSMRFVGAFLLPTNNVLELYRGNGGDEVAFVFSSLDVWLNATPEDLAASRELI